VIPARWGADDLTVRYGAKLALDGVRLEVPDGRITMVVGGDGAGKTTLLRALAGAVRPGGGGVRRPPARRLGYVSAGPGVYRDLTVVENLAFSGGAYGLRGERLERRATELLERTGLAAARDRLGGQLSGGMRQKLALAMALLHEPDLLVLDEPTTGVDPVSRTELWRLLARAAAGGAAVVLSTVYLDEAARAAGVLVLDEGRTLLEGPPAELVAAMPGTLLEAATRPDSAAAVPRGPAGAPAGHGWARWRRGPCWRLWSPDGSARATGAEPVAPDLEDAVIVASLARRRASEPREVAA
jgi:ABC-2 type transport system ATP-binding protein